MCVSLLLLLLQRWGLAPSLAHAVALAAAGGGAAHTLLLLVGGVGSVAVVRGLSLQLQLGAWSLVGSVCW